MKWVLFCNKELFVISAMLQDAKLKLFIKYVGIKQMAH